MKHLVIMNDCDGCTSIRVMNEAHKLFDETYGIPFSDSCWVFNMRDRGFVSLLEVDSEDGVRIVRRKQPEYDYLLSAIRRGEIDTLHTWGDFPFGGFDRELVSQAMPLLDEVRLLAWTAHGGENDLQNLAPLGKGDLPGPHYHLDYCSKLGICFFNIDNITIQPARNCFERNGERVYFKRFRGPTTAQVKSISLQDLPRQIRMAEQKTIWHSPPDDVILYTHFYATPNPTMPEGWMPAKKIQITNDTDTCLHKLADRASRGNLEITRFSDFAFRR